MLRICDDESILKKEFVQYLSKLSATDATCQLWVKFILEDCLPYVGLFISMRSGNWNLRLASLKQMAALFTAYDRTTYQKLIPRHIAELLRAPPEVLASLQNGGFAVSLTGMTIAFKTNTHSIAKLIVISTYPQGKQCTQLQSMKLMRCVLTRRGNRHSFDQPRIILDASCNFSHIEAELSKTLRSN